VVGGSGLGVVGRGQVAQGAVGPDGVVLDPLVVHQHLGLEQAVEGLHGEQFVAQPPPKLSTYGFCQGDPGSM
jgi:hypothetical protein